jgi:hypothetical protein
VIIAEHLSVVNVDQQISETRIKAFDAFTEDAEHLKVLPFRRRRWREGSC